jgi:hypothetical protein
VPALPAGDVILSTFKGMLNDLQWAYNNSDGICIAGGRALASLFRDSVHEGDIDIYPKVGTNNQDGTQRSASDMRKAASALIAKTMETIASNMEKLGHKGTWCENIGNHPDYPCKVATYTFVRLVCQLCVAHATNKSMLYLCLT